MAQMIGFIGFQGLGKKHDPRECALSKTIVIC